MIFNKIEEAFNDNKEKAIIQYGENTLYFNHYLVFQNYFVNELIKLGIHSRSCVAVSIEKSQLNFVLVASLAKLNAIVMMLDPKMSEYELKNYLQTYKPDILITDSEYYSLIEYSQNNRVMSQTILDTVLKAFQINTNDNWNEITKQKELEGSIIFFTSGSSIIPKAAFRTKTNIYEDAINNIQYFNITSSDKVLCAASISHVYGFGSGSIPYLASGATVKFMNPASTFGILNKELATNTYTVFVGLPIHYQMLTENMNCELNLRLAFIAGSVVDKKLVDSTHKKLGIYLNNMYGMTELGGITTLYQNISTKNMYSVGNSLSNVSIKMGNVVQEEANTQPLYEIYVKSKALSPGYYNYADGRLSGIQLSEGWFNTNDIGFIDENNVLYVAGRNENMINCSGKKINPLEIEDIILKYSGIKEAVVIGRSDRKQGEIPIAYVVAESIVDKKSIIRFCYDRLPIHKVPRDIIQVEAFPRTKTGKLMRNRLKDSSDLKLIFPP